MKISKTEIEKLLHAGFELSGVTENEYVVNILDDIYLRVWFNNNYFDCYIYNLNGIELSLNYVNVDDIVGFRNLFKK